MSQEGLPPIEKNIRIIGEMDVSLFNQTVKSSVGLLIKNASLVAYAINQQANASKNSKHAT
jgi:hypothetical protein